MSDLFVRNSLWLHLSKPRKVDIESAYRLLSRKIRGSGPLKLGKCCVERGHLVEKREVSALLSRSRHMHFDSAAWSFVSSTVCHLFSRLR
jgi:hypothetical protein